MPQIGEILKGRDIGKGRSLSSQSHNYIWCACVGCGKERWEKYTISTSSLLRLYCPSCSHKGKKQSPDAIAKRLPYLPRGDKHYNWKGGKAYSDGYVKLKISKDDFFMANKYGYIKEHRLVIAKKIGRCLQKWEIVHHKNGIRDDNRIENLELGETNGEHIKEHNKGYRDGYLKGYNDGINIKIKQLVAKIIELEAQIGKPTSNTHVS